METETTSPTPTRTYFRPTTASQRQLLFKAAETSTVTAAARRAHVGRDTYYHWLDRYATAGAAGLAQPRSCAPQHPRLAPISAAVCAEVLAYYDEHPHERGCRMIAERLRQAHAGQAVIGHSKVAELIRVARPPAASPAPPAGAIDAAAPGVAAVHAPEANQTVNIDLCVVPLTHASAQTFASVSVSRAAWRQQTANWAATQQMHREQVAPRPRHRLAAGPPGAPEPTGGLGRPAAGDGLAGHFGRH